MNELLLYSGGGLMLIWGAGHLFPTKDIVSGFGELSEDNQRIITMVWIAEGITLMFAGLLVIAVTLVSDSRFAVTVVVYRMVAILLLALALVSLYTGAKTSILPMKLCPLVKTAAAVMIIWGTGL